MTTAERIKKYRKARGWSMRELSEASGVSPAYISKIEDGTGNPTVDVLRALLKPLGYRITIEPIPSLVINHSITLEK